jgi:hypothetical protein
MNITNGLPGASLNRLLKLASHILLPFLADTIQSNPLHDKPDSSDLHNQSHDHSDSPDAVPLSFFADCGDRPS